MRNKEELLVILLKNIYKLKRGLCALVLTLGEDGTLSSPEIYFIFNYFKDNLPPKKFYSLDKQSLLYCFPVGQPEPRIDWLIHHINLNK